MSPSPMTICAKCKVEIEFNEVTGLWEDEDVLLCIGPLPFKHVPPWSYKETPKSEPRYGFVR